MPATGSARLRGRIAGAPGLWEIGIEKGAIAFRTCVDPAFADEHCLWITPGLFDLQVNGIGGTSFTDPSVSDEALAEADRRLASRGITRYLPTVITRDAPTTLAIIVRLREAADRGALAGSAGIHLEGPWVSAEEGWRGVHQAAFTRDPDVDELERLHEASGRRIRIVTLAPERHGAEAVIRRAVALGIVASLGHSAAAEEVVRRAADAGLTLSTHLFNGCARLIDRHRNPVFAQLAEDRIRACFIADGHHVPMSTLRVGLRAKGWERSILVSDIAPLAGLPDGLYAMEGSPVEVRDGGVFVRGSWMLSGAYRTLDEDVAVLGRESWPGIERALLMASRHPAAALGERAWSDLTLGRRGAIVAFRWDGRALCLETTG